MKYFFTLCLFFSLCLSYAQDTLYLNNSYEEVARDSAAYFQIDHRNPSAEKEVTRRTYWIDGQIKSERSFIEKKEDFIAEGPSKYWYENGQLFYQENYRKDERHGELIGYWEDGSKRRHDIYKTGNLKSGQVWDKKGNELEHFPIMEKPVYPGGQEALAAYLKQNIPVPETQEKNTEVRLVLKIRINKEGYIDKIEVIEGAPNWYNAVAVNVVSRMPRWKPGRQFGEPVNVIYRLPITFRK